MMSPSVRLENFPTTRFATESSTAPRTPRMFGRQRNKHQSMHSDHASSFDTELWRCF